MNVLTTCRSCGSTYLDGIFYKPKAPVAGRFLKKEELEREVLYPLTLAMCKTCGLVQVLETIEAEELFKDYRYLSSVSGTLVKHFNDYAAWLNKHFGTGYTYIDVGANDGILLKPLVRNYQLRAVGIDPALNIEVPEDILVLKDFFGKEIAAKLSVEPAVTEKPIVVTGSNVFAHIPSMHDVLDGVELLIKDDGYFIAEVNYASDILKFVMFDSVYHEHLFYWSVSSLEHILHAHGMYINYVEWLPMHGGSIRVVASKIEESPLFPRTDFYSVDKFKCIENYLHVASADVWKSRYKRYTSILYDFAQRLQQYNTVSAYGAAGRATMFFDDLPFKDVAYVIDESEERINRYVPKVHYPILPPEELYVFPTEACVISAWTYKNEIKSKERFYTGRWLVPFEQ